MHGNIFHLDFWKLFLLDKSRWTLFYNSNMSFYYLLVCIVLHVKSCHFYFYFSKLNVSSFLAVFKIVLFIIVFATWLSCVLRWLEGFSYAWDSLSFLSLWVYNFHHTWKKFSSYFFIYFFLFFNDFLIAPEISNIWVHLK